MSLYKRCGFILQSSQIPFNVKVNDDFEPYKPDLPLTTFRYATRAYSNLV